MLLRISPDFQLPNQYYGLFIGIFIGLIFGLFYYKYYRRAWYWGVNFAVSIFSSVWSLSMLEKIGLDFQVVWMVLVHSAICSAATWSINYYFRRGYRKRRRRKRRTKGHNTSVDIFAQPVAHKSSVKPG